MNILNFIISLLYLVSIDVILGFIVYMIWKYLDNEYFSKSEINVLKEENKYLIEQIRKLDGTSADFWRINNDNLY